MATIIQPKMAENYHNICFITLAPGVNVPRYVIKLPTIKLEIFSNFAFTNSPY